MKNIQLWKKITLALVIVFFVNTFQSQHIVFGEGSGTVYDAYKKDQKTDAVVAKQTTEENLSLAPQIIKFIFSFAAIIILLLLFLRFLKSRSKNLQSQGPFYSVGGHPLGGNRSLQLLMVGSTLYILGIGNDVRLLRTIEPGQEQDSILQSLATETERKQMPKLFSFKKTPAENWEETFLSQIQHVNQSSIPINKLKD